MIIDHICEQGYVDHVVGYQIAGGNTEEWFPFDFKGSVGKRSDESFKNAYPNGEKAKYRKYLNDKVADVIAELCTYVKEKTNHKLVVGSFYGYTFETPHWSSCHHSLMRLLSCDDIDFLCSPVSYRRLREPGYDFACMSVLDSIKYHGKLYFSECDIRTYLTRSLPESRADSCPKGTYEGGVWSAVGDERLTQNILRAVFARQLTHGNAFWWFDMFGGWFASDAVMEDMKAFLNIAENSLEDVDRRSVAELAVVAEDEQFLNVDSDCPCVDRTAFGLCGIPYDVFELGDIDYILSHYKAVIFVAPSLSDKMKKAIKRCEELKISYLIQDNTHIQTTTQIREMCKKSDVHLYCDSDDVLYVNNNYIVLHASTDGAKTLNLKCNRTVRQLFEHNEAVQTDAIKIDAEKFNTYIFRLD